MSSKVSKVQALLLIFLTALLSQSCVSVSEEEYRLAEGQTIIEKKSPAMATSLSVLPGVGNLYKASDEPSVPKNHELGMTAVFYWATWPVSILWALPQSYIDAQNINIKKKC